MSYVKLCGVPCTGSDRSKRFYCFTSPVPIRHFFSFQQSALVDDLFHGGCVMCIIPWQLRTVQANYNTIPYLS